MLSYSSFCATTFLSIGLTGQNNTDTFHWNIPQEKKNAVVFIIFDENHLNLICLLFVCDWTEHDVQLPR